MPIRLIIALPNRMLAVALAKYVEALGKDMMVCGVATESKQIFELLAQCPATVVVYDPYLPGPGPEVICCRLRREFPLVKVILMKMPNANGKFAQAASCLPAAIINSDAEPNELLKLITKVSTRNTPLLRASRHTPSQEGIDKTALTERELEVVELIARGHCAGEISDLLTISENTVRNHRQRILKKLGLKNKAQLISWYLSRMAA